ncbi:penicillin-binding protein 2 [Thermocrinis minervae]|uniref:Peptidoglycan glycosyltransferase n=1 Tax=Thermocrinis minervae TaxID=381751 RepID=A0A1M6T643_9AQUI|nr:penicillin-binding protein 2 [Thermocrinis minervae]SHK52329.1 peptidoglycan glycosyltransferase [Thermocrinis minervae]
MTRRRFFFLFILSLFLYMIVLVRLFYMQIIKGEYFKKLSTKNYLRLRVLYPERGYILDRNGVKLAYDVPRYMIFLDPQRLEDKTELENSLKTLKELFGLELSEEKLKTSLKGYQPIPIKKINTQEELDLFYNNSYKLQGFFVDILPERFYPMAETCAHVMGYVGYPTEQELAKYQGRIATQSLVGKAGIERVFDQELLGYVGGEEVMVDATGRPIKVLRRIEPRVGNTVVLTIDARIQKIAYDVFKESGHKAGGVLILHARTGEVLCLMSYPSYDPNRIADLWEEYIKDPYKPLFNRCLQAKYPPASVIKPALAIELLRRNTTQGVVCRGVFVLGNEDFFCWNRHGHGFQNIKEAIVNSCDVYFYYHGYYNLGPSGIEKTLRSFTYGEEIPFELKHSKGFIPNPRWKKEKLKQHWFGGDTVNMSIGQGYISATLLEQCLMMMGIANDGVIYTPTLVKEIRDPEGKTVWQNKRKVFKVVQTSLEHFALVREALRDVVRRGTATSAFSRIVDIAGKTGTAQVSPLSSKRKNLPYHLRDHAWFVGFAPYRDPIFIIGVIVEHGGSGGSAAAPIARRILERIYAEGINKEL